MSRIRGILAALAALLVTASADADIVELVTGQRVDGRLAQVTDDVVVLETAGGTVSLRRVDVRAVYFTPPSRTEGAAKPAAEVLTTLKHLQSIVTERIDHGGYVRQVAQGREVIDRYLKQPDSSDPKLLGAIRDAIDFYEFAASVWESRLGNSASASATIGRNALIDRCPSLQKIVQDYPPPTSQEAAWRRGVAIEFEVPTIWRCASEKVAETERALAR